MRDDRIISLGAVMWNNVAELSEFQLELGQSEGPKARLDVLPMAGVLRVKGPVRSATVQKSGYCTARP